MDSNTVRDARNEIGHAWGLGRHLTAGELGRILRMRGESAEDMILDYEKGRRQPTGPVLLALELMCEPPDERINEAMAALGKLSAEPHARTLGDLIAQHFGDEAGAVLEDIVLTVADIVRRPRGAEEAVAVTQFQNRDPRYRGDRPVVERRRRA